MKFREYLKEINTPVEYSNMWYNIENGTNFNTYINIDSDNNVYVDEVNQIGDTSFFVTLNVQKYDKFIHTKPVYIFKFEDRKGRTNVTGLGATFAKTLFGAIEKVFAEMIKLIDKDSSVLFSASLSDDEKSRSLIYDRFIKKILKRHPYEISEDILQSYYKAFENSKLYGFSLTQKGLDSLTNDFNKKPKE